MQDKHNVLFADGIRDVILLSSLVQSQGVLGSQELWIRFFGSGQGEPGHADEHQTANLHCIHRMIDD
jgi:hypothetical protein